MKTLRSWFLQNLFFTLALMLGAMQALTLHWFWVVVAERPSPGPVVWGFVTVALVGLGALTYPFIREARRQLGLVGVVARAYMSLSVATLLFGTSVALLWAVLLPLRALLVAAGLPLGEVSPWFRLGANGVLLLISGLILWGATGGQARFQRTRVRVPVTGLDPSLAGLRIVQISDIHIGNRMEGRRLDRLVARVNALDPDLIAVTGDIFDFDPSHIEAGARGLAGLRARHGVFAVLGNHDTYTGSEAVASGLRAGAPNICLLRGEFHELGLDAPLHLAGVDDPGRLWTDRELVLDDLEELGRRLPEVGPTILLVHRPDAFRQAARLGFSLVLSGHTHGGQIALPGAARRFNLARVISNYPHGLFRQGDVHLYVNRGAGVAGPAIRIAAPREITTLELHPA